MAIDEVIILSAAALVLGILAGCTGIGPALLPPLLAYFGGLNLHLAMATSMWSFLFTGSAGAVSYALYKSVDWRMALWLSVGIIPAAVFGARVNSLLSVDVLAVILAAVIILAGLNAFLRPSKLVNNQVNFKALSLLSVGMFVGFGSALTGTGGPILLIPILLMTGVTPLIAIGVSQVIILPLAAFSVLGYILYGRIDFSLGALMGVILAVGVVVGARLAHMLPTLILQRVLAVALMGIGALTLLINSVA